MPLDEDSVKNSIQQCFDKIDDIKERVVKLEVKEEHARELHEKLDNRQDTHGLEIETNTKHKDKIILVCAIVGGGISFILTLLGIFWDSI